jgi:hypothetical protein
VSAKACEGSAAAWGSSSSLNQCLTHNKCSWCLSCNLSPSLGENYRNINGCKTFAASIAQTLVDKQVQFQILSYKLGLGKSLTGLGLKKFKKLYDYCSS